MTLTEFLLARIAEDEAQAANISIFVGPGPDFKPLYRGIQPRVLAECEAKRRIVEAHPLTTKVTPVWSGPTPGYACDKCARLSNISEDSIVEDIGACETLMALALLYAEHPDYDETWRP